jgi:hypothetical protein
MNIKICRVCYFEKNVNEFNINNRNKDNLNNMCKECGKIYASNYRKTNYEKVLNKEREYESKNYDKRITYRQVNKFMINDKMKNYRLINKEKVNKSIKNSKNKRYKTDDIFKLKENIRGNINKSLKRNGYIKKTRTHEILGCSFEDFKKHIESLWESWMTWDNYGNSKDGILEPNKTWDIDHVIPSSNAKTEEELLKLNHFSNLQPLCSYFNRIIKKNQ